MNGGKFKPHDRQRVDETRAAADGEADDQRRHDQEEPAEVHRVGEQRHHDARQLDQRADG